MSGVVKNLMVRAGADFSAMRREMEKAQKNLADFKSGVSRTLKGIGAALATIEIGKMVKDAAKEAMGFEASMQQINRMLGSSATAFSDWANNNAAAFGMSKSEAVKFGAVYANLISGFSKDTNETFQRTQALLKASAVVASSTGRSMDDVLERIRSGLLGNTEAIEDLGINVNVAMIQSTNAFKKFANGKSWQQLDFQTQQQIRLFAILEQSANKYGTELAQNTNSRQAKFVVQLKNAQLAFGQFILPIYNAILPALTSFATALANVMNVLAQFSQALFGGAEKTQQKQADATNAQAGAVAGLGNAYEKAGKQAKGAVAGFDQVNLVGGTTGSGVDATGGLIPTDTSAQTSALGKMSDTMNNVSKKAQEMAQKVKDAFKGMKEFIVNNNDLIIASLAGLGAGFATFLIVTNWSAIIAGIVKSFKALRIAAITAWAAVTAPIDAAALVIAAVVAAVAALTAGFVYFYRTNEKFRDLVQNILQKIGETATWLWQNVMAPFGQWLASVFVAAWGAVTTAAEWFWKNVLVPLGNFLLWIWQNAIVPVGKVLTDVLGVAFQAVADIAKSFWKNVLVPLGGFFKDTLGPTVEAVSAVYVSFWKDVLVPFGKFLGGVLKPVWKDLSDEIVFLLNNVLKPLVGYVGGALYSAFNETFKLMGASINNLKTSFIGLMHFITGVFTNDWSKAWGGVKDIFKGVFDNLYAIIKYPLNQIIDGINALIGGLNKINIDVPDWVGKIPGVPDGISSFGLNIPKIPRLAKGGLAFGPTLATVGDNRNASVDPEVIAPLSKLEAIMSGNDNREVVSVLKAILQAVKQSGNSDTISMSKTALGRVAALGLNDLTKRTGVKPITI